MRFRPLTLRHLTCICTEQNHSPPTPPCCLHSYKRSSVYVLGWKGALLALAQLTHPALGLYCNMRVFCPRCRTLDFPLLNFMGFLSTSFLQPVQFLPNSSSPCQNTDCSHQLHQCGIVHKLHQSPLFPIIPLLIKTLNNIGTSADP